MEMKAEKAGLHPRNQHRGPYDWEKLVRASGELEVFLRANPAGEQTLDFADPAAVKVLNRALLKAHYGATYWDVPLGYLCPAVPGRADYLHQVADLLSGGDDAAIPRGPEVKVLDIGIGANAVYPLIGVAEYGWRFVGLEIDPVAVKWVEQLVKANPQVKGLVECRRQKQAARIFEGVVKPGERFAVAMCNPPFHGSAAEASAGTQRKVRQLGVQKGSAVKLNFGGQAAELWCPGGESGFIGRMIVESAQRPELCRWFTTLVSRAENLPRLQYELKRVSAAEVRVIPMAQGQKKSRLLAWRYV
jgi:23S rRNA (adenine1618-N6)-methyltransferase